MRELEEKILRDGRALNADVLLVDSFLNNQVDAPLMAAVGRRFAEAAKDLGITRVITIESSGIAPAMMTAMALDVPLVILKKSTSRILKDDVMQTEVFSFTKNAAYQLTLKTRFVQPGDKVLLVDDFLARGEAAQGASRLIEQAGASVAAIGIVIEKSFQPGRALLTEKGYRVISLARVSKMGEGFIEFAEADA
ncbi:MAG: xanthine phosphoribosyltransferase [Clostridia bacterium]|nr:xanthine phosphoribosyltransferase [Clostridia bacterium]